MSRFLVYPPLFSVQVPPAINQFRHTLEKNHSAELFRLLNKYKPESVQDKKKRLLDEAKVELCFCFVCVM